MELREIIEKNVVDERDIKIFDNTTYDERFYDNLLKVFSRFKYHYKFFRNMQRDLGEKANLYKKVFDNLFELSTIRYNGETRDLLQFRNFQDFKDDFDYDIIKSYVNGLEEEIKENPNRENTHIYRILKNLLNMKVSS